MGEKRFYLDEEDRLCIHYDDRIVACVGCRETEAEKIVDLLNELNELNEELNKQVNNYHATFQSLLKTNLNLNNQLAETQKELKELYESLFPKPDLEHLNCRCSYEPNE